MLASPTATGKLEQLVGHVLPQEVRMACHDAKAAAAWRSASDDAVPEG